MAMSEGTSPAGGALVPQKIDGNPAKGRRPTVAKYNAEQLAALQAKGHTFSGGTSYPIADAEDLNNAIHAVGRGGEDHDAIRKYVMRRAHELGMADRIPPTWMADGSMSMDDNPPRADLGLETSGFIRERGFPHAELEVRSDGRSLYSLAVPYDQVATVNDGRGAYEEMFRRGSFARTIAGNAGQRAKLMANHDHKRFPVGRATMLREDNAGLVGEFHVSDTRDGNEVLQLVRDGVLDSFSVGFTPIRHDRNTAGVVERHEVALREVSVVAFPAYSGATIAGVRAEERRHLIDLLREDPESLSDQDWQLLIEFLDTYGPNRGSSTTPEPATEGTPGAPTAPPEAPAGPTPAERRLFVVQLLKEIA